MHTSYKLSLSLSGLLFLLLIACDRRPAEHLTIATAASMRFTMEEMIDSFSSKTGIPCEMVVSSSGILTAQIRQGAPYDIFVSADMKYPADIHEQGLSHREPEWYATGTLVLWTLKPDLVPSLELLESEEILHIALANPLTAPYGKAALETLSHYDLNDRLLPSLVYGESISQTNQFITSMAADIGFTAKSVVLSRDWNGKGQWTEIDPGAHSRIRQGIVLINQRPEFQSRAEKFRDFLFSPDGKKILNKFGYQQIKDE